MDKKTALAYGSFDGIHLGHQAIIKLLNSYKADAYRSAIVLFPACCRPQGLSIFTITEEDAILNSLGLDEIYRLPEELCKNGHTKELLYYIAKTFKPDLLITGKKGLEYKKEGMLASSLGIAHTSLSERNNYNYKAISAKKIRKLLSSAGLDKANELLGRPYSISGKVVHGKALGRTIGMPTANTKLDTVKFLPAYGVYVTKARLDGADYLGLTHIGPRPSVDNEDRISIETFFMDFAGHIYDTDLKIDFLYYLRPILKLAGIEAVGQQVKLDMDRAKRLFS